MVRCCLEDFSSVTWHGVTLDYHRIYGYVFLHLLIFWVKLCLLLCTRHAALISACTDINDFIFSSFSARIRLRFYRGGEWIALSFLGPWADHIF